MWEKERQTEEVGRAQAGEVPFMSGNLLSRHILPYFVDSFRYHFPFYFSLFPVALTSGSLKAASTDLWMKRRCCAKSDKNLPSRFLSYFARNYVILLPRWWFLVIGHSRRPMVWDLQRISAEMGQARLWSCAQRVGPSCEGLWQPTPCADRRAGGASEKYGTAFSTDRLSSVAHAKKLVGVQIAIKGRRRFSCLLLGPKACCWGLLHRVGLSTSRCSYKFGYIWLSSRVGVQSFHTCIPQKSNGYFPPSANFKENTLTKHC